MKISANVNELINGLFDLGVTDINKAADFFINAGFDLFEVIEALERGVGGEWELELTYRLKEIVKAR